MRRAVKKDKFTHFIRRRSTCNPEPDFPNEIQIKDRTREREDRRQEPIRRSNLSGGIEKEEKLG